MLKTYGYLVSTLSVILLGIVAWKSASEQPILLFCLVGGMATSACGMFLRWLSHHRAERQDAVGQLASTSAPSGMRIANRKPSGAKSSSVVARRS